MSYLDSGGRCELGIAVTHHLELVHTATPDTTKLFCLCRVHFGGVDWIPDQLKTVADRKIVKSERVRSNRQIHTGTPDTTQTGPSCRVWCGAVCVRHVGWARVSQCPCLYVCRPGARFTEYLAIYCQFIAMSTYSGDLRRDKISFRNIVSQFTNTV